MKRWERIVAALVIFGSVIHASLGFVDRRIPAWTMFMNADRYDYVLVDRLGGSHSLRDYVQERAYVICDHRMVFLVARWLAETCPERAPFSGRVTVWRGLHPDSAKATRYVLDAARRGGGAFVRVESLTTD